MTLDREALRNSMTDLAQLVKTINRLGYRRGIFNNGLEVITTQDASDWVAQPCLSMRQAEFWHRQWPMVPSVDMGR